MSWQDRQYAREEGGGPMGGLTLGMPRPGRMVKWLLIVNVAVFVVQLLVDQPSRGHWPPWGPMTEWLGVRWGAWWQLWRYVTFQFLHSTDDIWHIVFNMLGVYFLGTALEGRFGPKRFLVFYLSCGIVAGVAYAIVGALAGQPHWRPIIGASGGVYGLVVAAAVFFPHFRILFLFFPVPIRLAAIIIFGGMLFVITGSLRAGNMGRAMSDVCHLGGAVAAAVWVLAERRGWTMPSPWAKMRQGAWDRKIEQRRRQQDEVDRILDKIHREGLASLTRRERQTLQDASNQQGDQERRFGKL